MVESGKIFMLRYLSPIRAESGRYCNVRSWHEADRLKRSKVCFELTAKSRIYREISSFMSWQPLSHNIENTGEAVTAAVS
ncbi:hypothetical protein B7C53_23355 [Escherichia coli]|nr:hypothetical protein B7C53_23355 [Escherichia coli]